MPYEKEITFGKQVGASNSAFKCPKGSHIEVGLSVREMPLQEDMG
jgi:hypothetical protein